jgi:hypothetical protein
MTFIRISQRSRVRSAVNDALEKLTTIKIHAFSVKSSRVTEDFKKEFGDKVERK